MRTFTKSLLASLVGIVVLASQATVFAQPIGPSPKTTGVMGIVDMKVDESGKIICPLSNTSAKSITASYKFTKWNGSAWAPVSSGSTEIPAKGNVNIAIRMPRTTEDQRVRLDVSAVGHISVALELKMREKRPYVLQYKTRGWVKIDYQFQKTTSELIGNGVNAKMAEAKALGFTTKKETEMTVVFVGTNSHRTYAYAKMDEWKEKAFATKEERDAFHRKIFKVVPPYTNDGPGLNTKLVER